MAAVRDDALLAPIVADDDAPVSDDDKQFMVVGFQLALLVEGIIHNAHYKLLRAGPVDALGIIRESARGVRLVRRAVRGELVPVTALAGFTNLTVPNGRSAQTPWGVLRSISKAEERFAPPDLAGGLHHVSDHGTVNIRYAGDVVLETELNLDASAAPQQIVAPGNWPVAGMTGLDRARRDLALTVTLAIERTPPVVPVPTWTAILHPFASFPTFYWTTGDVRSRYYPHALSVRDMTRVTRWAEIISENQRPSMEIAVRRLYSAMVQRTDYADALVDAVVVWESLFGDRSGELTLRIAASISRLLRRDIEERRALYREVAALYRKRSDVVHGEQIDESEAVASSQRAIEISVRLLRTLYKSRSDLIADPDRAKSILLE